MIGRSEQLKSLMAQLPGPRNVDRLRQACEITGLKEITLRIYTMAKPPRVPSQRTLDLLARGIANQSKTTKRRAPPRARTPAAHKPPPQNQEASE